MKYQLTIVPSNVQAMITGVQYAVKEKNGSYTLHYEDGKTENGYIGINTNPNDFFSLVSDIQKQRKERDTENNTMFECTENDISA